MLFKLDSMPMITNKWFPVGDLLELSDATSSCNSLKQWPCYQMPSTYYYNLHTQYIQNIYPKKAVAPNPALAAILSGNLSSFKYHLGSNPLPINHLSTIYTIPINPACTPAASV